MAKVEGLTNVKQISVGADCGLALKKDNTVWQWSFSSESTEKPIEITGFTGVKAIEAGRMEAYVIDGKGCGKDSYDGFSFVRLVAFLAYSFLS